MKTNKLISAISVMGLAGAAIVGCSVKGGSVASKPPVIEPQIVTYGVQYGRLAGFDEDAGIESVSVLLWPKGLSEKEMETKVQIVNKASKQITQNAAAVFKHKSESATLWEQFVEDECIVRFRAQVGCKAPLPVSHEPRFPEPVPSPEPTPTPDPSATPEPTPEPTPSFTDDDRPECNADTSITWKEMSEVKPGEPGYETYAAYLACSDNQKKRTQLKTEIADLSVPNDDPDPKKQEKSKNCTFNLNQLIAETVGESASLKIDAGKKSIIVFNDLRKNPEAAPVSITIVGFNDTNKSEECGRKAQCRQSSDADANDPKRIYDVSLTQGGRRLKFTIPDLKSGLVSVTGKYRVVYQFDLSRTSNMAEQTQSRKPTGMLSPAKDFAVFKGDVNQVTNGVVTHKGSGQIFGVLEAAVVQ